MAKRSQNGNVRVPKFLCNAFSGLPLHVWQHVLVEVHGDAHVSVPAATFLVIGLLKALLKRTLGIQPDHWVIPIAIVLGIGESYFRGSRTCFRGLTN